MPHAPNTNKITINVAGLAHSFESVSAALAEMNRTMSVALDRTIMEGSSVPSKTKTEAYAAPKKKKIIKVVRSRDGADITPVEIPAPEVKNTTGPKRVRKTENLSFKQKDLDAKDQWTTAEAAWFCGLTRTGWHVAISKRAGTSSWVPVMAAAGRGRGKQNLYDKADVIKFKAHLGK